MPSRSILKETVPLKKSDCFSVFARHKTAFDFPVHYHEEYELNFIENAKGVKRIVGDSVEEIDDWELVLIGPNIPHAWFTHKCKTGFLEITIQFHRDLFHEVFLKRTQLNSIRTLFEASLKGILFSKETIRRLAPRLKELEHKTNFDSVIELMSILNELSMDTGARCLSGDKIYNADYIYMDSVRMEKLIEFVNANFHRPVRLGEAAELVNMAGTAFSRYFKTKTGVNFVDFLNDIRLGHASRLLIDTKTSISDVAAACGFTNISNFNRMFKREKGLTPKDFRARHGNVAERIFF
ncbi:MAG: helix-turn-helix domain-containing protein [Chitinophagaceae bacterium]|nr:helix-turn-helix domain-containing protein [Chitinophagaceae bacterium]